MQSAGPRMVAAADAFAEGDRAGIGGLVDPARCAGLPGKHQLVLIPNLPQRPPRMVSGRGFGIRDLRIGSPGTVCALSSPGP